MLEGKDSPPRKISYNGLFKLIEQEKDSEIFETVPVQPLVQVIPDSSGPPPEPTVLAALADFEPVFEMPSDLPSSCRWDHKIHIPTSVKPINVHPYRNPYFQKTEIERQVKEMLAQGVIEQSTSPYSSPVLMARKKRWHFPFLR